LSARRPWEHNKAASRAIEEVGWTFEVFAYDDDSTRTNRAALDVLVALMASYFYVKIDESAPPNRLGEINSETAGRYYKSTGDNNI
jgi:hypothetical protein